MRSPLFATKSVDKLRSDAEYGYGLKRTLGAFDLILLVDVGPYLSDLTPLLIDAAPADHAAVQQSLGRPVRIGTMPQLAGLAEGHAKPGFATLAGLVLYAAADPVDIRSIKPGYQTTLRYSGFGMINRVYRALREYF